MGTEGKIRHMTIDVGAVGAPTPRDDLKESASKAEEVEKEKQD